MRNPFANAKAFTETCNDLLTQMIPMNIDWADDIWFCLIAALWCICFEWNLSLNTSLLLAHTARQTIRVDFWWSSRRAIWITSLQGGLSRNKVTVRERAVGSPPLFLFYESRTEIFFIYDSALIDAKCAKLRLRSCKGLHLLNFFFQKKFNQENTF